MSQQPQPLQYPHYPQYSRRPDFPPPPPAGYPDAPAYPVAPGNPGYPPPPGHPVVPGNPGYPPPPGHPVAPAVPGYGTFHGYPPPRPEPRTNQAAIVAVIFGAIGFILISVVFAIVALRQIASGGQKGKKLAYTALGLSAFWALVFGGLFIAVLQSGADRGPGGAIVEAGDVSIDELRAGDCIDKLPWPANALSVTGMPCSQEHGWEVFATFDVADSDSYPGEDAVGKLAENGCNERLAGFSAKAIDDDKVELYGLYPSRATWREHDDRKVTCLIGSDTARFTGTLGS
ncbi:septum formation family protein [Dactylosporangium sp. CS-033363]|uniref:DUF4190 domain-containing protein n=1 Tax=Dactylosporangium sp. CS-033363 TaxID=3239935 RepID=UPI003D8B19CB